jgi:hypothetical protein
MDNLQNKSRLLSNTISEYHQQPYHYWVYVYCALGLRFSFEELNAVYRLWRHEVRQVVTGVSEVHVAPIFRNSSNGKYEPVADYKS